MGIEQGREGGGQGIAKEIQHFPVWGEVASMSVWEGLGTN